MILNNDWMHLYIHAGKEKFKVIRICHSPATASRFLAVADQKLTILAVDDNNLVYITSVNPE